MRKIIYAHPPSSRTGLEPSLEYWNSDDFYYTMRSIPGVNFVSSDNPSEQGESPRLNSRHGETVYQLDDVKIVHSTAIEPEYSIVNVTLDGDNQAALERVGKAITEAVLKHGLNRITRLVAGLDLFNPNQKILTLEQIAAAAADAREELVEKIEMGGSSGDVFLDWAVSHEAGRVFPVYQHLKAIDAALAGQEVPVLVYTTSPLNNLSYMPQDSYLGRFESPDSVNHRQVDSLYLGEHDGSGITFVRMKSGFNEPSAEVKLKNGSYSEYVQDRTRKRIINPGPVSITLGGRIVVRGINAYADDVDADANFSPLEACPPDEGGIYLGNDAVLKMAKALRLGERNKNYSSISELVQSIPISRHTSSKYRNF